MKFSNTSVFNFENAIRGARNPLNSWDKSDSYIDKFDEGFILGENDKKLLTSLIKAGPSHAKFLRQIFVSVDITAPIYFYKELDTYKVSTTANSTSTMHKLASTPITMACFETDDMEDVMMNKAGKIFKDIAYNFIQNLEDLRVLYNDTKDIKYWKELIRWLPESWLQLRTWTANYAVLRNIYQQRQGHKLTEWKSFLNWIETLPYAKELITS